MSTCVDRLEHSPKFIVLGDRETFKQNKFIKNEVHKTTFKAAFVHFK